VVIATDSKEIAETMRGYGADVVMTPTKLKTGSDRVAEAARRLQSFKPGIVLNIQGDEPMIPPRAIDLTVSLLLKNKKSVMSTVAAPIHHAEELNDPSVVKVALKKNGNALYFSRSCIPFKREKTSTPIYKHFELTENLEQLRVLENGYEISVGVGSFEHVEVNTQQELDAVRRLIAKK
jgi:3-deoxy-manno-octulosonate cytidylyltransferase (CMP-KDO synthetase)